MILPKDGRGDIRVNKEIKKAMVKLGFTPQKIIDQWVKKNLSKLIDVNKKLKKLMGG